MLHVPLWDGCPCGSAALPLGLGVPRDGSQTPQFSPAKPRFPPGPQGATQSLLIIPLEPQGPLLAEGHVSFSPLSVPPLPTPADLLALSSRPCWVSPWVPLGPDIFFLSPCILAAPAWVLFQFSCLLGCPPWKNPDVQRGQSWWPFRRHVPLQSADAALFGKRVFADEIKVRISRLKHCG